MSDKPLESYFPEIVAEVKGFAIFMMDTDGVIQTWNIGCELMKGFKKEDAIGQNFRMLFPDFLKDQHLPEKERQIAKDKGRFEDENWRIKKNGDLFWAFVVLTRINDEKGKHIGYVKITQDQTDKKKYLDQLNRKIEDVRNINQKLDTVNNELLKSNSTLGEFAYASSHDLQAPLRNMMYYIERLKEELGEQLNEKQLEFFKRIENSGSRMVRLIEDLLSFSYIGMGTSQKSEIDLNEQVKDVLADLELDVVEKGAKITVESLPRVRGDRRQFQQFFQNLIGNAIKYAKPNVVPEIRISSNEVIGREAKASLPTEEANRKYYLIQLKDNGIGFEPEYAEDIFKVFTRLHGTSDYSGSGVGLSIVQKVVENHNGHIWAESKPGEGASFKILLPVD
ncbi:MAG TPA: ATP-binding protein [Flavisolibacter sp.]|jgi:PAS domain S-box-containing protein|nr:ATP-binding protein [Flavisolibacter sp.]